ncbi:biliverdin reductase A-like isoform X2 [Eleutherodactylus coqui]|uniref:biliverdin reductase A isoform X2 n=1 Tax=Eleutherodactylus coqui TaxID=57060 RepID=UPI003462791F
MKPISNQKSPATIKAVSLSRRRTCVRRGGVLMGGDARCRGWAGLPRSRAPASPQCWTAPGDPAAVLCSFFCSITEAKNRNSSTMFGVVVVGIGIAGSVRIRDLLSPLQSTPSESLKLQSFVSRRDLGQYNGVKQISLEEALKSNEIDAAFICTENQNHEPSIRRFLEAGKHVLVEYPVALSAQTAHELWQLAEQKGKVLHVEHIELLTGEFNQLKKEVDGKELVEGVLHFTGGALDEQRFGFPSFSGIARITWLVDLFGNLTVTSASKEENEEEKYSKLTAHFTTADNREAQSLSFSLSQEFSRAHLSHCSKWQHSEGSATNVIIFTCMHLAKRRHGDLI